MNNTNKMPLVTFAIFAYNQEHYIRHAIQGALAQDYPNIQFIFSDDFSSDNTFDYILDECNKYSGPHKIILNLNSENIGLANHINKVFSMANGEIIIAAAGDDISIPERTSIIMREYMSQQPKPLLINSSAYSIDQSGNINMEVNYDKCIHEHFDSRAAAVSNSIYIGATGAWSKELYSQFGEIKFENAWEDLVFGFRAIIENRIHYIDSPLIYYRDCTGLSSKFLDQLNILSVLRRRKYIALVMLDVMRQRNYEYFKCTDSSKKITSLLKLELTRYEILNFFYFNKKYNFWIILKNPFYAIRTLTIELTRIIVYLSKRVWLA